MTSNLLMCHTRTIMDNTEKKNIVRVQPRTFEDGWKEDLLSVGVHIPDKISEVKYTPVAHSPMPFSLEIDLDTMTLIGRVVGVMPNAILAREIYKWEDFCALINKP